MSGHGIRKPLFVTAAICASLVVGVSVYRASRRFLVEAKKVFTTDNEMLLMLDVAQVLQSDIKRDYDSPKVASLASGRYLRKTGRAPADAWGRPLTIYIRPTPDGVSIEIRSAGPDGILNTADDVVSCEHLELRRSLNAVTK